MSTICAYASFKASGVGVNSLTVTWDVERITRSDGTRSALVTGGSTNITIGRRGKYGYLLTGADLTLYDYVFTAITADTTVDQKELDALWTLWSLSLGDLLTSGFSVAGSIFKLIVDNLNATVSSRQSLGSGSVATTFALNDGADPLDGVDVWVSTDSAGASVVARGYTNASGVVTLMLDPGSYYVWKTLAGYNFSNPSSLTVT